MGKKKSTTKTNKVKEAEHVPTPMEYRKALGVVKRYRREFKTTHLESVAKQICDVLKVKGETKVKQIEKILSREAM